MLPLAGTIARKLGLPLILLAVFEPNSVPLDKSDFAVDLSGALDILQTGVAAYLDAQAAQLSRQGTAVTTAILAGKPAAQIVAAAEAHAGTMLVMSSNGENGRPDAMMGGVARRVVQHVRAPVLVARPPDAAA